MSPWSSWRIPIEFSSEFVEISSKSSLAIAPGIKPSLNWNSEICVTKNINSVGHVTKNRTVQHTSLNMNLPASKIDNEIWSRITAGIRGEIILKFKKNSLLNRDETHPEIQSKFLEFLSKYFQNAEYKEFGECFYGF